MLPERLEGLAGVPLLHCTGPCHDVAGELLNRVGPHVPGPQVTLDLEDSKANFDIDPPPLPRRRLKGDVFDLVFTKVQRSRGEQHVKIALNVCFRPANATIGKALDQFANFGCRQGHK